MPSRLTDLEQKKIIADYVECGSYSEAGKINGVSHNTVKKIILENMTEVDRLCQEKKQQNTKDILSYMDSKKDIVCEIISKGLNILNDEEKLKSATPSQITTALGTLIDKFTDLAKATNNNNNINNNMSALADLLKAPQPNRNIADFEGKKDD